MRNYLEYEFKFFYDLPRGAEKAKGIRKAIDLALEEDDVQKKGPKNMLEDLPDTFNESQLEALRLQLGKSKEGTKHQLNVWVNRGFITFSNQTGLYSKTKKYLKPES